MIGVRGAIDAYVLMLGQWPGLAGVQVLDGPAVEFVGSEGIAVGAAREDPAAQFTIPTVGFSSQASSRTSFSSMAWSGSGETVFAGHRDRTEALFEQAAAALDADRSLRGSVSTAWITGGSFTQEQTGRGVLVVIEFRIDISRF